MDIDIIELKSKLDKKEDFVFIDVREEHEYEEFNLGATLIPLGDVASKIAEYADQKDSEIVVHCRSGARSAMAQKMFRQAGFTNVRNLIGGALAWQQNFG